MSESPAIATAPDGTAFIRHSGGKARGEDQVADRPAVVLIHGLGLCQRLFDPMIAGFSAPFDLISYDLYGHGDSGPPPQTATLSLYSQQIAGLLDHLGIARAALVGFSIGGMINRRFALDFPDRLSALAILNSPHNRGEAAQQMVEDRAALVREQGTMSTLPDAL
ncbi:MAG: alpha/beta fold hydrolase, partial [Alphaproteobacteria bacterium]